MLTRASPPGCAEVRSVSRLISGPPQVESLAPTCQHGVIRATLHGGKSALPNGAVRDALKTVQRLLFRFPIRWPD
jgi:hypothetical protein